MRDIFNELSEAMSDPDPIKRAQIQMRRPLPKRFYQTVTVEPFEDGHRILLDGKPVRTPARHHLVLPAAALATAAAAEWEAQGETIDPARMPLTRLANTALDGVASDMQSVREDVLRFAATDLLCYRAPGPERLVDAQTAHWDPILDWASSTLAARFALAEGVMHVAQPREALAALSVHLGAIDEPYRLTALHLATSLTGSALIAFALLKGAINPDAAWKAAHVDEDWNAELWGEDSEAIERRRLRRIDFDAACLVLDAGEAR
jgi:chaperone required for assembly of F1-ATPase